jgi:amyloid beta precursor protein binding protein 1
LHAPFLAFKQFVDQLDLENMKHEQHSHIPFVVLLSKALDAWREEIGEPEALPTSYRMRKEFVALLMEMQKLNDQGIYNEENFAEAKQHLIRSFSGIEVIFYGILNNLCL